MSDNSKIVSLTLTQLLREIYSQTSDSENEGKSAAIKLSLSQKKALANLSYSDELKEQDLSELSKVIWRIDPTLKVFCEVTCAVYRNRHEIVARKFVSQAAKVVSDCDFLNPFSSTNIFLDVTSEFQSENTAFLPILVRKLLDKFIRRRNSLTEATEKAQKNSVEKHRSKLTVKDLNTLESSVLAIAALWCHSLNKVDSDGLINAFKLYKTASIIEQDGDNNEPNLAVFVAQQMSKPDGREFIEVIDYFVQQESRWKSDLIHKNTEAKQLRSSLVRVEQQKTQLSADLNAAQEHVIKLEQEIEQLKQQILSGQQEQKFERVHLRDDTERLRARSFNLLTEEILPLLATSLKVLNRETPIIDVAIEHIERAQEQVEGAIKWFKR